MNPDCKIVEISCLELSSQKVFDFSWRGSKDTPQRRKVPHPWTLHQLKQAPDFKKVMGDFISWLGKFPGFKILLAHNGLSFDAKRLIHQC
jgi:DNA polymerase III epsilon subunit-like protein